MRSVTRRSRKAEIGAATDTVECVVGAFERLLSQGESFTTVSVEKLAKEAGIARATYYLHFHNKGDLVRHVMKNVVKELRTAAKKSLVGIDYFGRSEFHKFMSEAVEIHYRHRAAIRAMVEVSAYDPEVSQIYQDFMASMAGDTRRVIEQLRASGRHHPAVSPEIAEILSWASERSCSQMLGDDAPPSRRQELANLLTHVVWCAIATPETKRKAASLTKGTGAKSGKRTNTNVHRSAASKA